MKTAVTHRHWIMLRYWFRFAPIEAVDLCRLPEPGPCPQSLSDRGIAPNMIEFIEECYQDLRNERKCKLRLNIT